MRRAVWLFLAVALLSPQARAADAIDHVLVIGVDGARPEALQIDGLTYLPRLIEEGTVCWNVQAALPSVTQVNWASMLSGASPQRTGIDRHPVTEEELAAMKLQVPTVFDVVARHGGTAAGFFGHWKLYIPLESETPGTHFVRSPYEARNVADPAAEYLTREKLTFCFVWMGDLDGRGHKYGWLSPEQLEGVRLIDDAIGRLLEALREAQMLDRTLILITSDHGGHGQGHGQGTAEDVTVPWIAWGPGVRRGHVIEQPFATHHTAATVLHALGIAIPSEWEARPVSEAFEAGVTTEADPVSASVYLTWQRDPTTTMTVQWLDHDAADDDVQYRRVGADTWRSATGEVRPMPFTQRMVHIVELTDLEPDAEYEFRLAEAGPVYRFATMPESIVDEPLRFVQGGDLMHQADWMEQTCVQAASHDPRFAVIGGDLAYANGLPERADRWFDFLAVWSRTMVDSQGRLIPIIPIIGNHEVTGGAWDKTPADAPMYYALFAVPTDPTYRALDFGSYLSLLLMDTDHTAAVDGDQLTWLDRALAERRGVTHVFPVYHVPAYPGHRSVHDGRSLRVREFWTPIFDRHRIDVAFENHDHVYKRTHRIRAGRADEQGVLYVGDGAWGVETRQVKTPDIASPEDTWYLVRALSVRHFILVTLQGHVRELAMYDSDGRLIDQYP